MATLKTAAPGGQPGSHKASRTIPPHARAAPASVGKAEIRTGPAVFRPFQGDSKVSPPPVFRPGPQQVTQRKSTSAVSIFRLEMRPAPPVFKPVIQPSPIGKASQRMRPLLPTAATAHADPRMPTHVRGLSVQLKSRPEPMYKTAVQPAAGLSNNQVRFPNSRSIQRAAVAIPDQDPWSAFEDWVADWIDSGGYGTRNPTVRRVAVGGAGVSIDYDIEFRWVNAFRYGGIDYDVLAHLHVRNEQSQAGGGIWAEGIGGAGHNWNTFPGWNDFQTWMDGYIE